MQAPTRAFNTITAMAAEHAQELLRLAEEDWPACQEYAIRNIPHLYRSVHDAAIIIRGHSHLEFHLRKDNTHIGYSGVHFKDACELLHGDLETLTAVLARY